MKMGWTIAAAIMVSASSAVAQRDTGQYGRPEQTPENMRRFAVVGSSFCANKNASATVGKIIASPIGSTEEAKLVKSLRAVARQCYQPQWPSFPATEVRNALAQIEYREHFKDVPAATPPGTKPPETFRVAPTDAKGTPEQESAWYLGALANCVVFVDAPGAHNLVIGPAGVPEEGKRFEKLQPALAQCGPPSGIPGLTGVVLRGFLADALLARAARGSSVK